MRAFRIADQRFPVFDGTGPKLVGGRWNSPGRSVIYAAQIFAGAVLEVLVHSNLGRVPKTHAVIEITVPDGLHIEAVSARALRGWDAEDQMVSRSYSNTAMSMWCGRLRIVSRQRLGQHVGLDAAQFGSRLEAQLSHEYPSRTLKRLESISLATGAIERGHELAPASFAEGVVIDKTLDDGEQLVVVPERKPRVDEVVLDHAHQKLDPLGVARGEWALGELGEGRAAVERQRPPERIGRHGRLSSRQCAAAFGGEPLQPVHVDEVGPDNEAIARAASLEPYLGSERLSQTGDVPLH